MKIQQCRKGQIYDIGFIDPYWVHEKTVREFYSETENRIVRSLRFFETKREILLPYNCK